MCFIRINIKISINAPSKKYVSVLLYTSALQSPYLVACGVGSPSYEVEESVYYMAVEPSDRRRDATEDDAVRDELIYFVDIETVVGCPVQSGGTVWQVCLPMAVVDSQVHTSGQNDGAHGNHSRLVTATELSRSTVYDSPLALMKSSKGNETGHTSDGSQED